MKTTVLIPMLALIFAIGMSFTTLKADAVSNDYIRHNGSWEAIPEQSCATGNYDCQVQLGEGGPIFKVYDEMTLSSLKDSANPQPTVINP